MLSVVESLLYVLQNKTHLLGYGVPTPLLQIHPLPFRFAPQFLRLDT